MDKLKELVAKIGWMRDCDFDEAIGTSKYKAPLIYASEEVLLAANPDLKDPECRTYPMRVAVIDADELEQALATLPHGEAAKRLHKVIASLAFFACSSALGPSERQSVISVMEELQQIEALATLEQPGNDPEYLTALESGLDNETQEQFIERTGIVQQPSVQSVTLEQPCYYCGEPKDASVHIRYAADEGNLVKHFFVQMVSPAVRPVTEEKP